MNKGKSLKISSYYININHFLKKLKIFKYSNLFTFKFFVVPWNMAWTRKNNISMGRKHVAFSGLGFQTRCRRPSLYGIYRIFVSKMVSIIMRLLNWFFFHFPSFKFTHYELLWLNSANNLVVEHKGSHVAAPRLDFWRIQVLGHLIPWCQKAGMKVKQITLISIKFWLFWSILLI